MTVSEGYASGRLIAIGSLALVAVVGFDLLLHAGALSRLYSQQTPFLLPAESAFRRIPLGYASFALLVVLLEWLIVRLGREGLRQGAVFGLQLGGLLWFSLALGLASISTARPSLLVGWAVGQTIELGVAGAVVGKGLVSVSLRGLTWRVLAFFVACAIAGVVLQNLLVPLR